MANNFNKTLVDFLTSAPIKALEDEIIFTTDMRDSRHRDINANNLLKVRKKLINNFALQHQKELLPAIVNFNDKLTAALHKLYSEAETAYNFMTKIYKDNNIQIEGNCYFNGGYPKSHPLQNNTREEFWKALTDGENNPLYEEGAADLLFKYYGAPENATKLASSSDLENWETCEPPSAFIKQTLKEFFFLDTNEDNWNEGLDEKLTKDLHLIYPFHNLFEHSNFALTDFIYCRDFAFNIRCDINILPTGNK